MQILLDTCVFIWCILTPERLSETVRGILDQSDTSVSVSAISCGEIACAVAKNRLALKEHWRVWFRKHCMLNGWNVLPADLDIMEEAYSLPGDVHNDPADRILIATSRVHRIPLITGDRKILDYPHVKTIWE